MRATIARRSAVASPGSRGNGVVVSPRRVSSSSLVAGEHAAACNGAVHAASATPHAAPRVVAGTASDHHAVFELLQRVFRAPSPDAFSISLEDPGYEPCDRLLLRRGDRLVGQVLLRSGQMLWGGQRAP